MGSSNLVWLFDQISKLYSNCKGFSTANENLTYLNMAMSKLSMRTLVMRMYTPSSIGTTWDLTGHRGKAPEARTVALSLQSISAESMHVVFDNFQLENNKSVSL